MKFCSQCGISNPMDEATCWKCKAPLDDATDLPPGTETAEAAPAVWPAPVSERPDGSGILTTGWVFLGLTVVLSLLALSAGDNSLEAVGRRWTYLILAGVGFQLFLFFWAVGTIVRAIWFLPGRQPDVDES